jgi:hypothetical protein
LERAAAGDASESRRRSAEGRAIYLFFYFRLIETKRTTAGPSA